MRTREFDKIKPYSYILIRLKDGKKYFGVRFKNIKLKKIQRTFLITGSAGFIGFHLSKKLLDWTPKRNLEEMCIDGWKWKLNNPNGF